MIRAIMACDDGWGIGKENGVVEWYKKEEGLKEQ